MIELMLQAERALSMGLVDQAEHLYWQAVESDGRNVIAIVGLAKVALARGDDRTALQFARKATELDPEDGAANRLVERLEDLARLRTGSVPPQSDPPSGPAVEADATESPAPVAADDQRSNAEPTGTGTTGTTVEAPVAAPSPPAKPSRADIEWPAADVLGAAPPIPPRLITPRPASQEGAPAGGAAGNPSRTGGAPGAHPGPPPEPTWPATLPPARPQPQRPPPEPEKKKGLLGRFRKNG